MRHVSYRRANRLLRFAPLWAGLALGFAVFPSPAADSRPPAFPRSRPATPATNHITWDAATDSLAAALPRQRLSQILPRLSQATGWRIRVEPGSDPYVSSTFRNLPVSEALERLLGGQSFSLRTVADGRSQLLVYRTDAASATEEVIAPPDTAADHVVVDRVANELLVKLKPGAKSTIQEIAAKLGAQVVGKLDGLDIYRLRFADEPATRAARSQLGSLPDVAAVGDNLLYRGPDPGQTAQFSGGTGSTGGLTLKPANLDRSKLIVGLIDTAVRPLGPEFDRFLLPAQSVVGDAPADGKLTHGTAMLANLLHGAQLTLGADQEAAFRVLPVNVYDPADPEGRATLFDVLRGTQIAIEKGASVINWSLSSTDRSPLAEQFTKYYTDQGVSFLAAAGNQPITADTYPAASTGVTAITAVTREGNFASYANRGAFIDVGLPGSDVVPFGDARYLISGTSTATAFGSGIVAARVQLTGTTAAEAVKWLVSSFPPPGRK